MFKHSENVTRSPFGHARQSRLIISHENIAAVRMWETSPGNGMGGQLFSRSNKWHFHATNILSAMSTMSALLSTKYGFVQREIAGIVRKCGENCMEAFTDYVNKYTMSGGALSVKKEQYFFCLLCLFIHWSRTSSSCSNETLLFFLLGSKSR